MDNLKLGESLGAVRYFLCLSACVLLVSEAQATSAGAADRPQLTQQSESSATESASTQKVQRLLKLLADRYPERYGSVDPGRLDGVLGEETKVAIRNFRKIAGLTNDPQPDSALAPAILSELAQMTSADAGSPAAAPAETVSAPRSEPKDKPAPRVAAKPAEVAPAQPAAVIPAQATKSRDADTAEPPRTNAILYFVQVASLRSIESAEREWERIKGENRAALDGEQSYLERADLRDRGIFHRILIGPMPSRDDANTLCGYLKQNDQTCVVTQRRSAEINKVDFRKLSSGAAGAGQPRLPWEEAPAPVETAQSDPAPRPDSAMAPSAPPVKPAAAAPAAEPAPPALPTPQAKTPAAPATEKADANVFPAPVAPAPAAPVATAPAETPAKTQPVPDVPAPLASAPPPVPAAETPIRPIPEKPAAQPDAPAAKAEPAGDTAANSDNDKSGEPAAAKPVAETPAPAAKSDDAKADENAAAREIRISVDKLQGAAAGSVMLAFLLAGGFLVYRIVRRKRQTALVLAAAAPDDVPDASPMSAMETERIGELESLSQLEEAFDSARLQESRRVRDAFLRDVLDDDPDHPSEISKRDSAIRVNSNLKTLLASDPDQYKAIFLNLIFLSKVGAALNRRDFALEELNGKFSREFMLLQSYFKIHVLELDDRHRIRQELPGLFYCLQLSQLHQRQGKRHFSAA